MPEYQFLDHTADLAIKVWGKDLPSLFINAVRAMNEYLSPLFFSPLMSGRKRRGEEIAVSAKDTNGLLVEWLSEILYRTMVGRKIYEKITFQELTPQSLKAEITGVSFKKINKDIKAVTYHNLTVEKTVDRYEVMITFDI